MALRDFTCLRVWRRPVFGHLSVFLGQIFAAVFVFSLVASPLGAQSSTSVDPNTPFGSPIAPPAPDGGQRVIGNATNTNQLPPDQRIEPVDIDSDRGTDKASELKNDPLARRADALRELRLKPAVPNEFEIFVEKSLGRKLPRFGAELLLPSNRDFAVPATATVPPDYILNVGDVVSIALVGSIDGSVDAEINTDGKIFLARVGAIKLAGVRYRDLKDVIATAIGRQYRGYNVTVSVKQLRGIRVYVTGFANNPGAYSVNSLSTLVNAVLAAGGPSSGGSFRSAKLYRNGQLISDFDLYDLLLNGDRSNDDVLQNEDVLFISPLGRQIAVTGSVNAEAIYEAKPGEALEKILSYAGGTGVLADSSRLVLYRLADRPGISGKVIERADAQTMLAEAGDIVQVLSEGSIRQPVERQSVIVRIEGEVNKPGNYFVPANTSLDAVLALAGGLSRNAFVFGTRIERASVRQQQREGFLEAVDQLEISLAATPLTSSQITNGDKSGQLLAAKAVLDRLRKAEPDGRMVLDIPPTATALPGDFLLENNDRIVIPPTPTTVGVFGAVYRPASFLITPLGTQRIGDYLERAGGPLRSADKSELFVVRANGAVISRRNKALNATALPGDVIFMPVKTQSSSLFAKLRDISTTVFQFGLSAAAFIAVAR
jgi:polysaccharide biosynthesis/export protein